LAGVEIEIDGAVIGGVDYSATGAGGQLLHRLVVVADGIKFGRIAAGKRDAVEKLTAALNGGEGGIRWGGK